ncbi:MAG: hypothetical protein WAM44_15915, partial [Chthoniobacterales bacterium]
GRLNGCDPPSPSQADGATGSMGRIGLMEPAHDCGSAGGTMNCERRGANAEPLRIHNQTAAENPFEGDDDIERRALKR